MEGGRSLQRQVLSEDLPPEMSERSATLAKLRDMFQNQFDNEIITCVAANFGWNERRSTTALEKLAVSQPKEEVVSEMDNKINANTDQNKKDECLNVRLISETDANVITNTEMPDEIACFKHVESEPLNKENSCENCGNENGGTQLKTSLTDTGVFCEEYTFQINPTQEVRECTSCETQIVDSTNSEHSVAPPMNLSENTEQLHKTGNFDKLKTGNEGIAFEDEETSRCTKHVSTTSGRNQLLSNQKTGAINDQLNVDSMNSFKKENVTASNGIFVLKRDSPSPQKESEKNNHEHTDTSDIAPHSLTCSKVSVGSLVDLCPLACSPHYPRTSQMASLSLFDNERYKICNNAESITEWNEMPSNSLLRCQTAYNQGKLSLDKEGEKILGQLQTPLIGTKIRSVPQYAAVSGDSFQNTAPEYSELAHRHADSGSKQNFNCQSSFISLSNNQSTNETKDCGSMKRCTRGSKTDRLANYIVDGKKVMILMRGLPGSGKSTLARNLVRSTVGDDPHRFIHSTDNFFMICGKGRYKFNPRVLQEAHTWNVKRVLAAAVRGITPIIVDNTNLEVFEMQPYANIAVSHGYQIEFLEPNTYWRYFVAECARRNTHGVPIQNVANMMRRFDRSVTVPQLLATYHFSAESGDTVQPRVSTTRMRKHRKRKRKRNRLKRKVCKSASEEKLNFDVRNTSNEPKATFVSSCNASDDPNSLMSVYSKSATNVTPLNNDVQNNTTVPLREETKLSISGVASASLEQTAAVADSTSLNEDYFLECSNNENKIIEKLSINQLVANGMAEKQESPKMNRDINSESHEYVLVQSNEFVFQKEHDIKEWLTQPLQPTGNTKIPPVGSERQTVENASNKPSQSQENDNIQLNFNFNREVNSLMQAMDGEEAADLNVFGIGNSLRSENACDDHLRPVSNISRPLVCDTGNELSEGVKLENEFELGNSSLTDDHAKKLVHGSYRMWKHGQELVNHGQKLVKPDQLQEVSSGSKLTVGDTQMVNDARDASADNNYVLWDFEHGSVWGCEEPNLNINFRAKENSPLPKPPRNSQKNLSVPDFAEENLHNLLQNETRPLKEIEQWDTVEDPTFSWEINKTISTDIKRERQELLKDVSENVQDEIIPQPQRSPCCFRSRKLLSMPYSKNSLWKSEQNLTPECSSSLLKLSHSGTKLPDEQSVWGVSGNNELDVAQQEHVNGRPMKDVTALSKESVYLDSVTNTHYSDFLLLQEINNGKENSGVRVLIGNSNMPNMSPRIPLGSFSDFTRSGQSGRAMFDKSSMTEHEECFTKSSETEFKELIRAFPFVPLEELKEIFQKCNGDINWTVDVLLEFDYKGTGIPVEEGLALKSYTSEISDKLENDFYVSEPCSFILSSDTMQKSEKHKKGVESHPYQQESAAESRNRPLKKDKNISVSAKALKDHLEQHIVLNDTCYSEHTLRIRKMRHGELLDMGEVTTSCKKTNNDGLQGNETNDAGLQDDVCDRTSTFHGVIGSSAKQNYRDQTNENSETNTESMHTTGDCEAYVSLQLGEELVSQLHQLFGKSSYTSAYGTATAVKLPVCLALQIHYYVMKYEEEQLKQKQKIMMKEDEELARKIQEKYGGSTKDESIPKLREIMDMEMALALYKAEQSSCRREMGETLAVKLSKRILCEMFPTVSKEAILELFHSTNNSFDDTLAILVASRSEGEAEVAMSPEALKEHCQQLIRAAEETVKRGVETSSPLEDFDDITVDGKGSSVLYIVERYREQTVYHYDRRNEYYSKAQQAVQKGMPSIAHYYSQMAMLHKAHAEEASSRAATAVSAAAPDTANLDLHGLYIREAICLLDSFLDAHIMRIKASGRVRHVLHIVTGRGNNSCRGQARLRPAIQQRLTQRSTRFEEVNEGLFRVVLNRNNDVSK